MLVLFDGQNSWHPSRSPAAPEPQRLPQLLHGFSKQPQLFFSGLCHSPPCDPIVDPRHLPTPPPPRPHQHGKLDSSHAASASSHGISRPTHPDLGPHRLPTLLDLKTHSLPERHGRQSCADYSANEAPDTTTPSASPTKAERAPPHHPQAPPLPPLSKPHMPPNPSVVTDSLIPPQKDSPRARDEKPWTAPSCRVVAARLDLPSPMHTTSDLGSNLPLARIPPPQPHDHPGPHATPRPLRVDISERCLESGTSSKLPRAPCCHGPRRPACQRSAVDVEYPTERERKQMPEPRPRQSSPVASRSAPLLRHVPLGLRGHPAGPRADCECFAAATVAGLRIANGKRKPPPPCPGARSPQLDPHHLCQAEAHLNPDTLPIPGILAQATSGNAAAGRTKLQGPPLVSSPISVPRQAPDSCPPPATTGSVAAPGINREPRTF